MGLRKYGVTVIDNGTPPRKFWTLEGAKRFYMSNRAYANVFTWEDAKYENGRWESGSGCSGRAIRCRSSPQRDSFPGCQSTVFRAAPIDTTGTRGAECAREDLKMNYLTLRGVEVQTAHQDTDWESHRTLIRWKYKLINGSVADSKYIVRRKVEGQWEYRLPTGFETLTWFDGEH
jgi:hypothetical protein